MDMIGMDMRQDTAPVAGAGCAMLVLILSAIGVAAGLSAAALSALLAVIGPQAEGLSLDSAAAGVAAVALLGLPLVWQAWLRLRGVAQPPWRTRRRWIVPALLVVPASLLIGHLLSGARNLPTVLREPWLWLALFAFAALLLALATDGWPGLSRLRAWGHLVSGSWVATNLAVGLTVPAVFVVLVFGLALLAAFAPEELRELMCLARNPSALADTTRLIAWATRPYVIAGALLVAAVVVPLIEELVKPVGVWVLWSRRPAPMAAFVGGALGGLGFALFEAFLNSAGVGRDEWAGFVVGRLGTTVMHVWASALTGWGIGQLFAGRWWRAVMAYFGAVLVHGLWNGNVIVASLGVVLLLSGTGLGAWQQVALGVTVGLSASMLLGLALASVFTLLLVGRWLRDQES
ncbi:MAG: PrsW family glutamic-type intramembrane protease [Anaerolineales bacterium]|nr:PrsW family glutamic-type intramembrane protease [Anaerolineales bacterium]